MLKTGRFLPGHWPERDRPCILPFAFIAVLAWATVAGTLMLAGSIWLWMLR